MTNVSACILSFNRASFLREALDSVLEQTLRPAEIMVFDNGSEPTVLETILPYLKFGVKWIPSNVTNSANWNFQRAINSVKHDFLFVLHDDDRLCHNFIEQQIGVLQTNRFIGAVTCNGYLINKIGERTGGLVFPRVSNKSIEYYNSPAAVAKVYASDTCLPFSPFLYRSSVLHGHKLRSEFGKVVDAVFLCELAKTAVIACQQQPLYECRIHPDQDSSFFDDRELIKLADYFETEVVGSDLELKELSTLLTRQHTSRQLIKVCHIISSPLNGFNVSIQLSGLLNDRFSIWAAIGIIISSFFKRISNQARYCSNFVSHLYESLSYILPRR